MQIIKSKFNYTTKGFWSELDRPELSVKSAITAIAYGKDLRTFRLNGVICDFVLSDIAEERSRGANNIWAVGDPVHLSTDVYSAIGRALSETDSEEPRKFKQARIESVVVCAGPPNKRANAPVRLSGKPGTVPSPRRGRGMGSGPYRGRLGPRFGGRRLKRF